MVKQRLKKVYNSTFTESKAEQFDDIVEGTLKIINDFEPDLNATVEEQLATLESLGKVCYSEQFNLSVDLNWMRFSTSIE